MYCDTVKELENNIFICFSLAWFSFSIECGASLGVCDTCLQTECLWPGRNGLTSGIPNRKKNTYKRDKGKHITDCLKTMSKFQFGLGVMGAVYFKRLRVMNFLAKPADINLYWGFKQGPVLFSYSLGVNKLPWKYF